MYKARLCARAAAYNEAAHSTSIHPIVMPCSQKTGRTGCSIPSQESLQCAPHFMSGEVAISAALVYESTLPGSSKCPRHSLNRRMPSGVGVMSNVDFVPYDEKS